jgi:hypothetical protein
MLRFLDALRGRGGLEGPLELGDKSGWSPCSIVTLVLSICGRFSRFVSMRDGSYHGAEERRSTWNHAINAMWPWFGPFYRPGRGRAAALAGNLATSEEAIDNEIRDASVTGDWRTRLDRMRNSAQLWQEGRRTQQWTDVLAYVEEKQDGTEFWANALSAVTAECITWRNATHIIPAVGLYWRDNMRPKLPDSIVQAFEINNGRPMTLGVLARTAIPLNRDEVSETSIDRLVLAGLLLRDDAEMLSLPVKQEEQPAAQAPVNTGLSDARPGTRLRNLGEGRIVWCEHREGEYGLYTTYIVVLDSREKIIFSRSGGLTGDQQRSRKGIRVRIGAGTYQRRENDTFRGRPQVTHYLTRVLGDILWTP